jgi:hypothetical protein
MSDSYPFPKLDEHGYEFVVVNQEDTSHVLAAPLPPEEERFAAKPGDMVKLIFAYRETMEARGSGQEFGAEHMWVEITGFGNGCLVGRLDSSPQYTKVLKSDDAVAFHPKHIIAFWRE